MRIRFTWRIPIPDTFDPSEVVTRFQAAFNRANALDVHLAHGTFLNTDTHILAQVDYDGMGHRDRWWIQRRMRYAMVALAVRAKMKASTLELVEMEVLPNKQAARKPQRHPNAGARTKEQRWQAWQEFRKASAGS